MTTLTFQWDNINGEEEKFDDSVAEWFEKLRNAAGGEDEIIDFPANFTRDNSGKDF